MIVNYFPQAAKKFEIQAYEPPDNIKRLRRTHVAFTGAPQKHPCDSDKILLITDPYSSNAFYYEFRASDVSYAEELPNLVNLEGEILTMVRIWVKKNTVAIRCTPFLVGDTWEIVR